MSTSVIPHSLPIACICLLPLCFTVTRWILQRILMQLKCLHLNSCPISQSICWTKVVLAPTFSLKLWPVLSIDLTSLGIKIGNRKKNKLNLVYVRSYSICAVLSRLQGGINTVSPNKKIKVSFEREDLLRYKTNPREIYPSSPRATDEWVELSRQRELLKWSAFITTVSYVLVMYHSLSG